MRVLFVCTGNTCRSPMAERLARLRCPQHHFESAGVLPQAGLHPLAARVLSERGAEVQHFTSRSVHSLELAQFTDIVLIGPAAQRLQAELPEGVRVHRWDVADPYEAVGTQDEQLAAYRLSADELERRLTQLVVY